MPTLHRTIRRLALAACALLVVAIPAPAQADVAYRSQTCRSQTYFLLGSFSMNRPAGVVAGDVLIATLRVSSFLSFNFSTPSGWTELGVTDNNGKLFMKVAGGSEPSSYNFGSMLGLGATMVGTIVAFSGADPASPIGASIKTTGTSSGTTVPDLMATRNGSLSYVNITAGATVTPSFTGGLSGACAQSGGGVTVANGYVPTDAGMVSGLGGTLSSSTNWVAQSLILRPASACTAGSLAMSDPGTISFPSTALDGTNRTVTTNATIGVSDMTDTALGWNLSATSTRFTNGAHTLAAGATTITGLSVAAGATNCGLPLPSGLSFPMTLPAGTVAPPATKIGNALLGSGMGLANLTYSFALALPANIPIGTYTSTWTFTLASGP